MSGYSLDPRRLLRGGSAPGTVVVSAVVGLDLVEVWGCVSAWGTVCVHEIGRVSRVSPVPSSAAPLGAVGSTRLVEYGPGAPPHIHTLLHMSETKRCLGWRVDMGDGAVPVGSVWEVALRRVTETGATYVSVTVSGVGGDKDARATLASRLQGSLAQLRMVAQNTHELSRVRSAPFSRPNLLLQSVNDAVLSDAADALAGNSAVTSVTLAHGTASGPALAALAAALVDAAGVAVSLRNLTLSSITVEAPALAEFLAALAAGPSRLSGLKLLGSTVADADALQALLPSLEALADGLDSLVQIEVHVESPTATLLPSAVVNRVQRNRLLALDDPAMTARLQTLDIVLSDFVDVELAARAALALASAAPALASLWIHDVGAPRPVFEALVSGLASAPALQALRVSLTRNADLDPTALQLLVDTAIGLPSIKVLELDSVDLVSGSGDPADDPVLSAVTSLIRADTGLEVLVMPQPSPLAESTLTALAAAIKDASASLLVLELSQAGSAPSARSPLGDDAALAADPGLAQIAAALLDNRAAAVDALVTRLRANTADLTMLHSELLMDAHSITDGGIADALRSNTTVEIIRHFHISDAAAAAFGAALLDNPESAVSLVQLDGCALSPSTCDLYSRLVHSRENISISLGPLNPYDEHSRSFTPTPQ